MPFNMDERNKQVAGRVIVIMYFLTILAMQGIVLYRQLALGQDIGDFEDIGILLTVNVLFLVSALLYFGAITIRKLSIKMILLIFLGMVILGSLFTYARYNVFQSPGLTWEQLFYKLIIIVGIIGIIMGSWILLSILGKRRIEKELEDE
jgi:glucan phosphoethanolaminetransferase (alkaline phosphatase superfamily)